MFVNASDIKFATSNMLDVPLTFVKKLSFHWLPRVSIRHSYNIF